MKKIALILFTIIAAISVNAQTEIKSDISAYARRGATSDTITGTDTIGYDNYYTNRFSKEVKFYHQLDTVYHEANDTIEVGIELSYDYVHWIAVDRDTVIVSSSHNVLQESTTVAPFWRAWARGLAADGSTRKSTKWKYTLLIDVNK